MTTKTTPSRPAGMIEGQPRLQQPSREIQTLKQIRSLPLGLPEEVVGQSVTMLNQILADSLTLYDLYKKHHWQVAGPTFYQLHLLLDKHAEEVEHSIDFVAERIQMLGGVAGRTSSHRCRECASHAGSHNQRPRSGHSHHPRRHRFNRTKQRLRHQRPAHVQPSTHARDAGLDGLPTSD